MKSCKIYSDFLRLLRVGKDLDGSLELAKLNFRQSIEIPVVVEHLEMPDQLDELLNSRGPGVLVVKLEPLRKGQRVIPGRKPCCLSLKEATVQIFMRFSPLLLRFGVG